MTIVFALGIAIIFATILLLVLGSIAALFLLAQFCKGRDLDDKAARWVAPWKIGWVFLVAALCVSDVKSCSFTLAYVAAAYWCYAAFRFREMTPVRVRTSLSLLVLAYGLTYGLMSALLPYHVASHKGISGTDSLPPHAEFARYDQWEFSGYPLYTDKTISKYDANCHCFLHKVDWQHPVFIGHQYTLGWFKVFTTS